MFFLVKQSALHFKHEFANVTKVITIHLSIYLFSNQCLVFLQTGMVNALHKHPILCEEQ